MKRLIAVWGIIKGDIMLLYRALIDPQVDVMIKAAIVAMVLYILSPLDVIPDTIPLIGQLDDVGIVLFAFNRIKKSLSKTPRSFSSSQPSKSITKRTAVVKK